MSFARKARYTSRKSLVAQAETIGRMLYACPGYAAVAVQTWSGAVRTQYLHGPTVRHWRRRNARIIARELREKLIGVN